MQLIFDGFGSKCLRWVLCGAAFAAIAGSCGCTLNGPARNVASTTPPDDSQAFASQSAPVNVFGEVGGVAPNLSRPVGDEGFVQQTFADEGYDSDVCVAPDGKEMVFASTRHSIHASIYSQRVDGTAVTKLTSDDSDNGFPCFSSDGKQIAFCSTRSGIWNIYVMDGEGRNVVQITNGDSPCIHPSFSPDGGRLVFSMLGRRSNEWELWTVDLVTGQKRQIGYGLFPSWSPEKSVDRIAFQRARQRGSRWFSLWTLDLVDGDARRVTEVAVSSNAAIVAPGWSPDGKRLVFATIVDPAHAGGHRKGEQDIWTIAADGSDRRRLTDGNGTNLSPAWASNNRVYFISDRSGTECVWSVRPEMANVFTAAAGGDKSTQSATTNDPQDVP